MIRQAMIPAVQTGADHVEDLVPLLGTSRFGATFFAMFDRLLGIDHCTVFISTGGAPRACLAEARIDRTAQRVRDLASNYVTRSHAADPVWSRFGNLPRNTHDCFFLRPEDIGDSDYRREYYTRPNIHHELAVTAAFDDDERIYAAFYREHGRHRFDAAALDFCAQNGRLMLRLLQKHWHMTRDRPGEVALPVPTRADLFARVREALIHDDRSITPREAEICASIVLGYTVLGISLNLGISVNTVATHRKRAYAKLRISSQNELFALYFSLVEHAIGTARPN